MKLSHLSLAVFSAIALAACGGSGSSSSVNNTNGNGNDDENKDKKEDKVVVAGSVSDKVELQLGAKVVELTGAAVTVKAKDATEKNVEFPGTSDRTVYYAPAGDLEAKLKKVSYVPNPLFYNGTGGDNLKVAGALKTKLIAEDATSIVPATDVVFYKDGKDFVEAKAAQADDGKFYFFKTGDASEKKTDTAASKALKASELYQKVTDTQYSKIESLNIFDQKIAPQLHVDGVDRFANIDRSKIKTGEIVTSKLEAAIQVNDFALGAAKPEGLEDLTKAATGYQEATNADGVKQAVAPTNVNVKIADVKAYNLPFSFVALTTKAPAPGADEFIFTGQKKDQLGAYVDGVEAVLFPKSTKAAYKGKAFTNKSTGDIQLDVNFVTDAKALVESVKITSRTGKDGSSLKDLETQTPVVANGVDATYDAKLFIKDSDTQSDEIKYLQGQFFGLNAEETAGALYEDNSTADDKIVGVFAAQK